jgi:acyl-CoA thioester hydrolase
MQREAFSYFYSLRVRYAEVDAQGVVFNAHYLTYFDTAITEFFRASGYSYADFFTAKGLDFHLIKATVEYLKPIGFDMIVEIGVRVARIGTSSVTFALGVFAKDQSELLSKGEIIWVCAKPGTHKSHRLPEEFVALFKES